MITFAKKDLLDDKVSIEQVRQLEVEDVDYSGIEDFLMSELDGYRDVDNVRVSNGVVIVDYYRDPRMDAANGQFVINGCYYLDVFRSAPEAYNRVLAIDLKSGTFEERGGGEGDLASVASNDALFEIDEMYLECADWDEAWNVFREDYEENVADIDRLKELASETGEDLEDLMRQDFENNYEFTITNEDFDESITESHEGDVSREDLASLINFSE